MNTVQSAFNEFYHDYEQQNAISAQQAKVSKDIMNCRTAAMGGHTMRCNNCGHTTVHYNSCRNRHCPQCQGITKAVWVDNRTKDVINAPYFHLVFTIPQILRSITYQNKKLLYNLMYMAVAETISELSLLKKYLGAQVGFFSLLHTWAQDLHYHPHIHTVLLAGGLTEHKKWRCSKRKFLIPVKVLAKKFRGKYLYYLKQYYLENKLCFYGDSQKYQEPEIFQDLLNQCYSKDWYTYAKNTFAGPWAVIKYLGQYTHQIAISNERIISVDKHLVIFTARDKKRSNTRRQIIMKGPEFIRRFLMHVLPKGFVKIRYYGLLANVNRKTKLELCRKLTNSEALTPRFAGLKTIDIINILIGRDITICQHCGKGKMQTACYFQEISAPP